jgi:hypothetical protein
LQKFDLNNEGEERDANSLQNTKDNSNIKKSFLQMRRPPYNNYNVIKKNRHVFISLVSYALKHGATAAQYRFKVPRERCKYWINHRPANGKLRMSGGGRKPALSNEGEKKLHSRIMKIRANGGLVTLQTLKLWAVEQAKSEGLVTFKASNKWCYGFMKRWKLSYRIVTKTKRKNKNRSEVENQCLQFWYLLRMLRKTFDTPLEALGNMDETGIWFEMPPKRVLDVRGRKGVRVLTAGQEKQRITVVLGILANGDKLPPMIIFRGKTERSLKDFQVKRSISVTDTETFLLLLTAIF